MRKKSNKDLESEIRKLQKRLNFTQQKCDSLKELSDCLWEEKNELEIELTLSAGSFENLKKQVNELENLVSQLESVNKVFGSGRANETQRKAVV